MQAKKYIIEVCDSALEWSHGFKYKLVEYYIPDLHVFVNEKAIFRGDDEPASLSGKRVQPQAEIVELDPQVEDDLKNLVPLLATRDMLEKGLGLY